jgi:uncharacterized protein (TIGR02266 family)
MADPPRSLPPAHRRQLAHAARITTTGRSGLERAPGSNALSRALDRLGRAVEQIPPHARATTTTIGALYHALAHCVVLGVGLRGGFAADEQRALDHLAVAHRMVHAVAQPLGVPAAPPLPRFRQVDDDDPRRPRIDHTVEVTARGGHLGFTEDLSAEGIFLATYHAPPVGQILRLRVPLPHGGLLETRAEVRWVREGGDDAAVMPGVGLALLDLDPVVKATIAAYVTSRPPWSTPSELRSRSTLPAPTKRAS